MADTQETIADIIAEKRRQADEIERDCAEKMKHGEMDSDCYARELVADIRREADRLEAAHRRELAASGNAAKLREALTDAEKTLYDSSRSMYGIPPHLHALLARIRAALAAPPRNCDVGNTENQHARFVEFCRTNNCDKCPLFSRHGMSMCFAQWAQMPYEETEGGAK